MALATAREVSRHGRFGVLLPRRRTRARSIESRTTGQSAVPGLPGTHAMPNACAHDRRTVRRLGRAVGGGPTRPDGSETVCNRLIQQTGEPLFTWEFKVYRR